MHSIGRSFGIYLPLELVLRTPNHTSPCYFRWTGHNPIGREVKCLRWMDERYTYNVRYFPLFVLVVVVKMRFYVTIEQLWPYLWALSKLHIQLAVQWDWEMSHTIAMMNHGYGHLWFKIGELESRHINYKRSKWRVFFSLTWSHKSP